jgi:hypothetical protein
LRTRHTWNFPSVGLACGQKGTPPPSFGCIMATTKNKFEIENFSLLSSWIVAFTKSLVKICFMPIAT